MWMHCGFTLVELMIALTISAVLLGLGVPAFTNMVQNTRLTSYANNLVASMLLARGEAIKRNAVVTMCVSADNSACGSGGWEQGWIILADTAVIHSQPAAAAGYRINGTADRIDFQPTGLGATQTILTICREADDSGTARIVTVNASGRPAVTKAESESC
jgi:type IV fimbrial biogenesis protein FimT